MISNLKLLILYWYKKEEIFTRYLIIIPPFYRDIKSSSSGGYSGGGGYTYTDTTPSNTPEKNTPKNNGYSEFGNSKETSQKKDYYFSNGYQPRYVNNSKLGQIGVKVSEVFGNSLGVNGDQKIWKSANNRYYVWNGKTKSYIDVTSSASKIKKQLSLGDKFLNLFR